MNIFYKITILLFASGVTAGVAQIVLAREISNQAFLTNNLIAFMVLSWVAGAVMAFQVIKNMAARKNPERDINYVAALAPVVNAFCITAAVILVRYYKPMLKLAPETAAPDWVSMILSGAVFIPISFLVFAAVFSLMEALKKSKTPRFIFAVLLAVAGGVVVAYAVYALWAVKYYTNLDVAYTVGIFNMAIAYLFFRDKTLEGRWIMIIIIISLIVYLGFNMAGVKPKVDEASSRALYRGYTVIAQKEFPTVNFCMAKKGDEYRIYENGTLAYKIPDPQYVMMARLAKGPRVLVINGGLAGMSDALSKNTSVKEIICLEADPYMAVVLEKVYRNYIQTKIKTDYISSRDTWTIEEAIKDKGLFNTIIVNPRLKGFREGKHYFSPAFKAALDKLLDKEGQIIYGGNQ